MSCMGMATAGQNACGYGQVVHGAWGHVGCNAASNILQESVLLRLRRGLHMQQLTKVCSA